MSKILKELTLAADEKFRIMKDGHGIVFIQKLNPSIYDEPAEWRTIWSGTEDFFGEARAMDHMKTIASEVRATLD